MINTISIKRDQLTNTYFQSGSGNEKVLIMGSCRVAPYVEYLDKWNEVNGNRFTIYSIDPFNHNWNHNDERVDYESELLKLETDERLLSMLKSVDIFIHEYYQNAGLFNVNKSAEKNIYQFGLSPKIDVCIPNFNDVFILFKDIVTFDVDIRKKVMQDINVIGRIADQTLNEMYEISQKGLNKFYDVCSKSDIPEMKEFFEQRFTKERLFWTYNHVAKGFTLKMFSLIDEKYLHLGLDDGFWFSIYNEDMFANNYTHLTEYDVRFYGYSWGEEIKPIL